MASATTSSLNNCLKRPVCDDLAMTAMLHSVSKLRGLATLGACKEIIHTTLTKNGLAKAGFIYCASEHQLRCRGCDFQFEVSRSDVDPVEEHLKRNPQCTFAVQFHQLFPENKRFASSSTSVTSETPVCDCDHQKPMDVDVNNQQNNSDSKRAFLNTLLNEAVLKLRTDTFTNWPSITPSAKDMIAAGWSYTNIADRVICVECNVLFHQWTESDRPYEVHRLRSPRCPFVLANEKNVASLRAPSIVITTQPDTQALVGAASAKYTLATRRYESFQNWPHTEETPLPSIESFVNAGFYYTGEKTVVRCFYCNNALRNWQAIDDPKIEHARWYPHCAYIRQYVGEDLYQAIQRKNRELKAQQSRPTSQITPWTNEEIDRMVKARLDLPIVQQLRGMGFSMALIRKTFEMQLRFKKDDFKTDNDLRYACLILDRQVTLINGNEGVLVIPQNWMKTYLDNPEQHTQESHAPRPQTIQPSTKLIETPKVIAPIVPRPRIVQKTDDEALLCVLCLTTERQVACLPCGHLTSCVACGHSLKTCPICRATVNAFVRIYV